MVSMCKMVQPTSWSLQCIFICSIWFLGAFLSGMSERSSVGIHQEVQLISKEDVGDIVLFGIFILLGEIGKKLDKGYRCPTHCEVNHNHIYWEIEVSHVDTLESTKKVLAYNP